MCVVEGLDWKCFRKGFAVFTVLSGLLITTGLLLQYEYEQSKHASTVCKDNLSCPAKWHCCAMGCCGPVTASPRTENAELALYDAWYMQWPVLFFASLFITFSICWLFCFCRRRYCGSCAVGCFCRQPGRRDAELDSAGSLYPPPRYSRCGSFPQAPPPYSEVQSKPDLYPLVITCAEGDGKNGSGGSYFMVQYFRNCVIRPPQGSLSGTSTLESLNSSFICNAANEANSIIPPPYSCSNNFDEYGAGCRRSMLHSMSSLTEPRPAHHCPAPREACRNNLQWSPDMDMEQAYDLSQALALRRDLLDCEMYCEGSWRMSASPTRFRSPSNTDEVIFEPDAYEVRHVVHPPPEPLESPTSPSQTSKESRTTEERRQRCLDSIKRNIRKSSLYMPLSTAHPVRPSRTSPGARASSRSAPATPCSNLVPNLLNFTHRASRQSFRASRLEEEYDSLITDVEQEGDHKF